MTDKKLPEDPAKWKCNTCGAVTSSPLYAPSPFDPIDVIHACPSCLEVNNLTAACQHPDCSKFASGGHPGGLGYRYAWLCWDHSPDNPANKKGDDHE